LIGKNINHYMKNLKNYKEFVNENIFYDENGNKFDLDLWQNETLLSDIPEMKKEELDNLNKIGYRSAEQLYSVMCMKNLKEGILLTMDIDESRYDEIIQIMKKTIHPEKVKEIENYIPVEYAMGAKRPPK
jgi:hypothetical protein